MPKLGRLERVPLRDVWKSESSDFTPWLAEPEHIGLLAEAIGLELEVEAQEKSVGQFRADILCKELGSDAWVLIENQLEATDHKHLGQLITYAAGLEAVTLVWVAERFNDDHRAALDWLNEIGREKLRCFGLEIELWQIGDSAVAPKFNVVCQPNDWTRTVATTAEQIAAGTLPDGKQLRLEYWTAFVQAAQEAKTKLKLVKPPTTHWMSLALGRSGIHLDAVAILGGGAGGKSGEVRADVYIDHPQRAKAWYAELEAEKEALEAAVGEPLTWLDSPNARACRIGLRRPCDIRDRDDWPAQHAWLRAKLERLHAVFGPRAKKLGTTDGPSDDADT